MNKDCDVKESINTFRRRFFDEYRNSIENGKFCVDDIRRLRTEDWWVESMLYRFDNDVDVALPGMVECLKWRHDIRPSEITPRTIADALVKKVIYCHGCNNQNQPIVWINGRYHKKSNSAESQRCLVYWLEKHYFETCGSPCVIIFDMFSTGLQNMDLELVRYLLTCLKQYYPGALAYLLVYDLPWILNAAWKIIKSWLDAGAQKKIIFVNNSNITDYIDKNNLPRHIGGTDDFEFDFAMYDKDSQHLNCYAFEVYDCHSPYELPSLDNADNTDSKRKSVTFADESSVDLANDRRVARSMSDTVTTTSANCDSRDKSETTSKNSLQSMAASRVISAKGKELAEQRINQMAMATATNGSILAIVPKEELRFVGVSGEQEYVEVIGLRNFTAECVSFKVKTTSPEKFRVRPSSGLIKAGELVTIKIYLQAGYQQSVAREKFLVLSALIPAELPESVDSDSFDLNAFWKQVPKTNVFEKRLRCKLDQTAQLAQPQAESNDSHLSTSNFSSQFSGNLSQPPEFTADRPLLNKLSEIQRSVSEMQLQNRYIKMALFALFCLLVLLLLHQKVMLSGIRKRDS